MEGIKLLVTKELVSQIFEEEVLKKLEEFGKLEKWGSEDVIEFLAGATIIITSWGSPMLKEEILQIAPNLRFIFHAAGTIKHMWIGS